MPRVSEVLASLLMQGYTATPLGVPIVAAVRCAACGHRGMTYVPFMSLASPDRRAFVVCPSCAWAERF